MGASRPCAVPRLPTSESWLTRVRENLRQLFVSPSLSPSSSNGTPIHLVNLSPTGKAGRAQTASLLTHGAIIAVILFLAMQPRTIQSALSRHGM